MSNVILQTERLTLRPFASGDGPAYYSYMSDPAVIRYTAMQPLSRENAEELVQSIVSCGKESPPGTRPTAFGITLRTEETLIGNCRLGRDSAPLDQADIAYFFHTHYWRQGYATEAVRALIEYGFRELSLRRIYATCVPENVASVRVLEKVGMQEEDEITTYASDGNWWQTGFQDVVYRQYAIYNQAL